MSGEYRDAPGTRADVGPSGFRVGRRRMPAPERLTREQHRDAAEGALEAGERLLKDAHHAAASAAFGLAQAHAALAAISPPAVTHINVVADSPAVDHKTVARQVAAALGGLHRLPSTCVEGVHNGLPPGDHYKCRFIGPAVAS